MKAQILYTGVTFACPTGGPNSDVQVSVHNAGWIETTENRVLRSGRPTPFLMPLLFGRIHHPDGDVYVDAGLGETSRAGEYPRFPLSTEGITIPAGSTLAETATDAPRTVLITHLHYDHIGGLLDLDEKTEVWITETEWSTARTSNIAFPENRMMQTVSWKPIHLASGHADQRLGRPALDVKGDGTIWYISTPGHTPGSASVLVHAADSAWLFIGDIAWVDAHLHSASRPAWVSLLVDGRPKLHKNALAWARQLRQQCPNLNIVAGHEPRWTTQP